MARKTQKKENNQLDICFVIMPFGSWFDNYYQNIYIPAITKSGMTPRRADDLYRPSSILQDIWALTKSAKIIIADLSTKNPNVFYELGLAHALAKPAILITESLDDVPFDLRNLRIIEYEKNEPNWGSTLMEKIRKAITETKNSPNETVPIAFLDSTPIVRPVLTKEEKSVIEMKQDIEFLKNEVTSIARQKKNASVKSNNVETAAKSFMQPLQPSPILARIIGSKPIPRTEAVKKIWLYIKQHKLQDNKNVRMINSDENLLQLFGGKRQVSMFDMAKYLSKHLK
ncbi:MAG: SWIB/MDM2 domain-containing protein [Ferruginibacter sp.]